MNAKQAAAVRYRLERAATALDLATEWQQKDSGFSSVNRAYYACFYAVSALLLCDGLTSKKHSGIKSLFQHNWIKSDRLPRQIGRSYERIYERRLDADYQDMYSLGEGELVALLADAQELVAVVTAEVEARLVQANREGADTE